MCAWSFVLNLEKKTFKILARILEAFSDKALYLNRVVLKRKFVAYSDFFVNFDLT